VSVADLYDGFREFFVARRGALSRTAFLLTGDHGEAEDLLQEALTKTVGRWRKVSAGDNPEGYVRQVMLNEVRSRWRRRRRGVEHPV
jgi:DNA-directed RNA polymerase specialized sigma24 family protein